MCFKVRVQHGVPYRCWIHMKVGKPKGKSQANLLYVQFTNAVDKANKEVFKPGTGSYLAARGVDPLVVAGRRFAGPNRWPDDLPGFRETVLAYTDAVDAFARRLLPVCAVALELRSDYFDAAFAQSRFSFRLSHYPPVEAEANQFGIAPHTDANFMTFLAQTDVPGLQVRMPSGEWLDVPYVSGSFAVNSGDMMARWTNGRFKSTPYRAVPPVGRHRYAIPYFLGPHLDTVIECLPTCQGPDTPSEFPPITYSD